MTRQYIVRGRMTRLIAGLSAIAIASLLGPGLAPVSAATPAPVSMSGPAPVEQAYQALAHAHSYRATLVVQYHSSAHVTGRSYRIVVVGVRQGAGWGLDITTMRPQARGLAMVNEIVTNGTRACSRQGDGRHDAWNCHLSTLMQRDINAEYASFTQPHTAALYAGATRLPRTRIDGQLCIGYSKIIMPPAMHGQQSATHIAVTLWIAATAPRLVEQQTSVTAAPAGSHAPLTTTVTLSWSNWNDPTLTIPPVPAR